MRRTLCATTSDSPKRRCHAIESKDAISVGYSVYRGHGTLEELCSHAPAIGCVLSEASVGETAAVTVLVVQVYERIPIEAAIHHELERGNLIVERK